MNKTHRNSKKVGLRINKKLQNIYTIQLSRQKGGRRAENISIVGSYKFKKVIN